MVLLFNTLNIAIIAENIKLGTKKSAQKLFGHPLCLFKIFKDLFVIQVKTHFRD